MPQLRPPEFWEDNKKPKKGITAEPFTNLRPSRKERDERINELARIRKELIGILNELSSMGERLEALEDRKALRERIKQLSKDMDGFLKE